MAVVFDPNKDDQNDKQNQQGQPQQTNTGQTTVTAGASPTSASPGQPNQPTGTSSGSFSNLTNYLKANQNYNNEGGGLAGKVATNLNNQGDQVTKNVANAVQNFNNQAQGQVQQVQSAVPLVGQAVANPNQFAQNQDNVKQVQNVVNANYSGPKSLLDLQGQDNQASLEGQAKQYADTVNQGKTESGRFGLLRTMFNKPTYTSGQQNLDNLLIQGNPNQLQQIQNARKGVGQVNQNLNQAETNTQNQGQQAAQQIQQTRNDAVTQLNQRLVGEGNNIDQNYNKALQDQSTLAQNLKNGSISADQAKQFGLFNGQDIYNRDLSSYLTGNATKQNTATAENYAQIAALKNMLGSSNLNDQASQLAGQYSDASQAGTYKPTFNSDEFLRDVANDRTAYENQVNPIMKEQQDVNNSLNGDLQVKGGVLNAIKQMADQTRQQNEMLANNPATASAGKDYSKMSDIDIINQLAQIQAPNTNNYQTTNPANNAQFLANEYNLENQKKAAAQAKFDQLQQLLGKNKHLTYT